MVPFALPRVGLLQQKWKLQAGRRFLYPTFPRCRLGANRATFYLRPDQLLTGVSYVWLAQAQSIMAMSERFERPSRILADTVDFKSTPL